MVTQIVTPNNVNVGFYDHEDNKLVIMESSISEGYYVACEWKPSSKWVNWGMTQLIRAGFFTNGVEDTGIGTHDVFDHLLAPMWATPWPDSPFIPPTELGECWADANELARVEAYRSLMGKEEVRWDNIQYCLGAQVRDHLDKEEIPAGLQAQLEDFYVYAYFAWETFLKQYPYLLVDKTLF